MKMSEMKASERPRERMLETGVENMGDSELLAVLLRTGTRRESATELAMRILSECNGSLTSLFGTSLQVLQGYNGIGPSKACIVQAAFELGRRFMREYVEKDRKSIMNARMLHELMLPVTKGLSHEECWIVYLNAHNKMIRRQKISSGGDCSTTMDVRQITRCALENKALGLFLVHNHPSGSTLPSESDIRSTEALKRALEAVGISLIDHVIISDMEFYSFAEQRVFRA